MNAENSSKKVILSGIQPSGKLGIGNYLGALKSWLELQQTYDCIFLVVDLHALTVPQVPAELRKRCLSFVAQYIACGIDPQQSTIVMQSHVPEHAELAWILNTLTSMGELSRMTQFKGKSSKDKSQNDTGVGVGLFTYPVLMAADILLYQADLVPVGADQKQHLELTRDLAQRFDQRYSPTFTMPEIFTPQIGARIMSLQEPHKKMSKSDAREDNAIALLDPPDVIRRKVRRAVTDSDSRIHYDPARAGLANLLTMLSALSGDPIDALVQRFDGQGYGALKKALADALIATLEPIQSRYSEIMNDKEYLGQVLAEGAEKARRRARKTLSKVYRKVGLVPPQRR